MEYSIEATGANEVTITITGSSGYSVSLEPTKITPLVHTEEEANVTVGSGIIPTDNVYSLIGDNGDEFIITFGEDGVYKLYIEENGISYIYIFFSINSLDEWLYDSVNSILCLAGCTSTAVCNCEANCRSYYAFNVVSMISMTFFGEANLGVAFNYNQINGGYLYEGYTYKCINAGGGTFNWLDGSDVLLLDSSGNEITNEQLVVGREYTCIRTGAPTSWGSTQDTILSALTDSLVTRLNYIADAVDRFERYIAEPINCDCQ